MRQQVKHEIKNNTLARKARTGYSYVTPIVYLHSFMEVNQSG